ncbi:Leukotriene A-4 hydrolase -like protein [Capsicum chinense]|nr:Leukotriene A-4 hydrolase -like protein [Capsicum chinense]
MGNFDSKSSPNLQNQSCMRVESVMTTITQICTKKVLLHFNFFDLLVSSLKGFTLKQLPSETLFGKSAKLFNIAILRLLYDTIPFGDLFCMKGITTYAERRIIEAVQGEGIASLNIGIGWKGLVKEIERFKDNMEFTKLKTRQACVDPEDVYSVVPYEKGFQFLWRIERQIGRSAFDDFLKKYSGTFKFQSSDTDMFLNFLKANVPGIENKIDLKLWTEGTGIPPDAMEPVSNLYSKIVSLANEFNLGRTPREDEVADWKGQEWELYLKNLPRSVEASQGRGMPSNFPVFVQASSMRLAFDPLLHGRFSSSIPSYNSSIYQL